MISFAIVLKLADCKKEIKMILLKNVVWNNYRGIEVYNNFTRASYRNGCCNTSSSGKIHIDILSHIPVIVPNTLLTQTCKTAKDTASARIRSQCLSTKITWS